MATLSTHAGGSLSLDWAGMESHDYVCHPNSAPRKTKSNHRC